MHRRNVFHLPPNRKFRKFWRNGKRPKSHISGKSFITRGRNSDLKCLSTGSLSPHPFPFPFLAILSPNREPVHKATLTYDNVRRKPNLTTKQNSLNWHSLGVNILFNCSALRTGHFRVPKTLTFKMRLGTILNLSYENEFNLHDNDIPKAEYLPSVWNRGPGELGNGLNMQLLNFKTRLGGEICSSEANMQQWSLT